MIRAVETADLPVIRAAGEALAVKLYPELIPAIDKEVDLLRQLATDTTQYAKAVGKPGEPRAVLVAKTGDNLWATRRHATILLWYSEIPGAGAALLRDFREWVRGQKSMALAGLMDDFGFDDRLKKLLQREEFVERGGAYVFFPRGALR